jgi:hypothetical protein
VSPALSELASVERLLGSVAVRARSESASDSFDRVPVTKDSGSWFLDEVFARRWEDFGRVGCCRVLEQGGKEGLESEKSTAEL